MSFEETIKEYAGQPLTRQIMLNLLREYKRPYDKISELEKEGKLLRIKRGLYITGSKLDLGKPPSFLIGNQLYGPSYVSLETALAYWKMIPERVFETASVSLRPAKIFETPAGRFSYTYVPLPYYAFGIRRVKLGDSQQALIASPEKALCDKIVTTAGINLRSIIQTEAFLLEDLRMEKGQLRELNLLAIEDWIKDAPKRSSLFYLIKFLKRL